MFSLQVLQYLFFINKYTDTGSRVESNHAYIKQYLGAKKTEGNLFVTIAGIEAGVTAQISNIITKTACEQDSVPLDID